MNICRKYTLYVQTEIWHCAYLSVTDAWEVPAEHLGSGSASIRSPYTKVQFGSQHTNLVSSEVLKGILPTFSPPFLWSPESPMTEASHIPAPCRCFWNYEYWLPPHFVWKWQPRGQQRVHSPARRPSLLCMYWVVALQMQCTWHCWDKADLMASCFAYIIVTEAPRG